MMKKRVILPIIILLMLGSCVSGNVMETGRFFTSGPYRVCPTDDGVYFAVSDGQLLYHDFQKGKSNPLCGQSECRHQDRTCSSYLTEDTEYLFHFITDGRYLYYFIVRGHDTASIIRTDLDGENKTVLCQDNFTRVFFSAFFERKLYYAMDYDEIDEETGNTGESVSVIRCFDLDSREITEPIKTGTSGFHVIGADRQSLFFYTEVSTAGKTVTEVSAYDMETQQQQVVFRGTETYGVFYSDSRLYIQEKERQDRFVVQEIEIEMQSSKELLASDRQLSIQGICDGMLIYQSDINPDQYILYLDTGETVALKTGDDVRQITVAGQSGDSYLLVTEYEKQRPLYSALLKKDFPEHLERQAVLYQSR